MKLKHYIISALILCTANQSFTQESFSTSLLHGSWSFDYDSAIEIMDDSSKENLDSIPYFQLELLEKNYRGRLVTFRENGKYEQVIQGGNKTVGSWILSEDKKTIVITNPYGTEFKQKIKVLKNDQLVLKPITDKNNKMLIPLWVFIKKN